MKQVNKRQFDKYSWRTKALTTAVLIGLTASVGQAADDYRKPIGDLEIYKAAKGGKVTITMMVDTSGSMGLVSFPDNACDLPDNLRATSTRTVTLYDENSSTTPSYKRYYCKDGTTKYYTRLTRLQDALFTLMDSTQLDPKKVDIGIGQYPISSVGKILVPARPIDQAQRTAIKEAVAKFKHGGGTPTAYAYAEAGAYMMGTTTVNTVSKTSGFAGSVDSSKNGDKYISPLTTSASAATDICDGRGIYFLTDGEPKDIGNALPIMAAALNKSSFSLPAVTLPNGSRGDQSGMPATGAFAQALRNPSLNPLGQNREILTAVVGFGSDFNINKVTDAALPEAQRVIRNLSFTNSKGKQEIGEFYNCANISNIDIKNACNWGTKSNGALPNIGGYGEGGFYSAESSDEVVNSIINFVSDLNQTIPVAPSGTITIPNDPYQASNQLAYAYLPMLDPNVGSAASIWRGNLRKYNLNQGTLFGKNATRLYTNTAGDLNTNAKDLWQKSNRASNDIEVGGVYAQLRTPQSGFGSIRKVYVEDIDKDNKNQPILRLLSVDGTSGKPVGFDKLEDAIYTQPNQRRLLNFLGFEKALDKNGAQIDVVPTTETPIADLVISDLTLVRPVNEIRLLGGVVHSKPTAISYSADLDGNGRIDKTRDDYVLFGSMDGALHLVNSDDGVDGGKEVVAIIPKLMLEKQSQALVKDSKRSDIGNPYFGVDAPWLVTTDYKYDLDNSKVKVDDASGKGMFAYGGLRMGGEAIYGMNITDKADPKILFVITPDGRNDIANTANRFTRLGQIWSKPVAAKIGWDKNNNPRDVLIFGGGYDMAYEDENYVPTSNAPAKGSAIYMIDAKTGRLLWSTSSENGVEKNVKTDEMIHSITGGITVLDRDNDGLMDHLYAADLGGQVFRADFENARAATSSLAKIDSFSSKGVTRILNSSAGIEGKYAYRFYERPVVSFYRSEGGTNNGSLFALVNVISGNRSAPLSKLRDSNVYANRVYGIIDTDVTNSGLYSTDYKTTIKDVTEAKLVNLSRKTPGSASPASVLTAADKVAFKNQMISGGMQGWYYPLTRFDGYNNVRYNKGIGDSVVINSLLYTTVYNPDKQYGTVNSCSARIIGGSERQLYCLPYGICDDDISVTGTGGFVPAGQGIQELTLGAFNADNTNLKVLIGTTTIIDRILEANRVGYSDDSKKNTSNIKNIIYGDKGTAKQSGTDGLGDGSAPEYIFNERYTFQPKVWYERQQ
ncbi:PilC/PilY family type IV pilus protein [Psychrobacter glacincola]|uniref:PilC/PilY family type IV pilus protein n=1 Tax=Psychrobacter glacincola TaxID=56810 RepID=A0ABW1W359_9GAMM|nr:PilC/PilY family type IV pilus protein [Psychrobacter glacincola]